MKVLLIGSGGREHAMAWALKQDERLEQLFVAPGNAGILEIADKADVDVDDHAAVADFCQANGVDFVIVGPEAPLVDGISDVLRAAGVPVVGPSKAAAELEGSKSFVKQLAHENGIPTAASETHTDLGTALEALDRFELPVVVKADGLAAGKGVFIAETREEAEDALNTCFGGAFGLAGATVVIEEFLVGEEISCFALCDGLEYVCCGSAQDHKRVGEGDTGPNTGGMGAYSPAPCLTDELRSQVAREIVEPTLKAMKDRGTPFQGILFSGIMITASGPKLLEFNVRFGDPETQVIMPRLQGKALKLFHAAATGKLSELCDTTAMADNHAMTVVLAAQGYPAAYDKGSTIVLPETTTGEIEIFHAGTARGAEGALLANGGRVLAVTGLGDSLEEAKDRAYATIDSIKWPQGFCRRDIGWRALGTD